MIAERVEAIRAKYEGINDILAPSSSRAQVIQELARVFKSSRSSGLNSIDQIVAQLEAFKAQVRQRVTDEELLAELNEVITSIHHKLDSEPGFLENSVAWIDANLTRAGQSSLFSTGRLEESDKYASLTKVDCPNTDCRGRCHLDENQQIYRRDG